MNFFTDPILRAPLWGTLLMCIASSLMGVVILLRRQSLLAEALSHSAYPGMVLAVSGFAVLFPNCEEWMFLPLCFGALATSFLALKCIEWIEAPADAALGFVLSLFFGAGIVAASGMQAHLPKWHQAIQMLLFGQAATMTDFHMFLYAALACLVAGFLALSFRSLQAILFDRSFAASLGLPVSFFERGVFWLLLISLIVGMRSVGVVLMSGMAIAPAVAARQCSDRLQTILWLAACFGALSGLLGNILSVALSLRLGISLPTGPAIILVGTCIALLALSFAPQRGLVFRLMRIARFRCRCLEENILKGIWKKGPLQLCDLRKMHPVSLRYPLLRLRRAGWLERDAGGHFTLTADGMQKARAIVRLHRLWELYLTEELGLKVEHVHRNAEEMEHILTPDLEKRLTHLLLHPKKDPHQQPIPEP